MDWIREGDQVFILATLAIYVFAIYVSAQEGSFLSLDCGGTNNHTDGLGIHWIPDDNYITTGESAHISSSLKSDASEQFQRVRYFPDTSRKHCYALPVVEGGSYIVRPGFYSGNYDNLYATEANFEILIGATAVENATINFNDTFYRFFEFLVKAIRPTIDLCLASNSTLQSNVPFISTIELRKLDPGLKPQLNEFILQRLSLNFGTNANDINIRYPDDPYDRIWVSYYALPDAANKLYNTIKTDATVLVGETSNKPPSAVMKSACTSNSTMVFTFPLTTTTAFFYVANFYFAEFANNTREFYLRLNKSSSDKSQLPELLSIKTVSTLTAVQYSNEIPIERTDKFTFSLVPLPNSTLGPILNAIELFRYITLVPQTEYEDVIAIQKVMNNFNLSGWSGDPCFPHLLAWKWITCDVSGRIIELNLAGQQLNGIVPESIKNLTHLRKIYLDNNALIGTVPNFSSLKNLTVLSLQNNSLECKLSKAAINVCEKIHNKDSKSLIIDIAVPCSIVFLGAGFVSYFLTRKKNAEKKTPNMPPKSSNSCIKKFSYKDLINATNNFRKILGEGSFGPVYYGCLPDGEEVAVKVSSNSCHQEYITEIDILSVVHHKNLVSFLGYCNQRSKLILIYEYMSNGNLRDSLYGKDCPTLSWRTRLGIALDAAQGVEYLHTSCNLHIIHRDVKTTNILLNSAMVAKVGDFGLSKTFDKTGASHITTIVKGTPGYLDPEYHSYNRLTEKSDVYSFGVVLFEIICARKPINTSLPEDEVNLPRWACQELQKGNIKGIIDPRMPDYNEQAAWKVLELAMNCVEQSSEQRPTMTTVVNELREAIQLQEEGSSLTKSINMLDSGR